MSNFVAVVGAQFGDEGKGKIVNFLSQDFDYVVRYQGGDNAGHTININNKKHVLKSIPSGIFKTNAIVAPGTVINPEHIIKEIEVLSSSVDVSNKLFIAKYSHVVFDFHIAWDFLCEKVRGNSQIGCTHRGIGPCYSDKSARFGIRMGDLLDYESLLDKIRINLSTKNPLFKEYGMDIFNPEEVAKKYHQFGLQLAPYFIDYFQFLNSEISKNKKFLFEGSQGMMLDLDCGTYPFVTSSNIIGSLSHGANLPISTFKKIIGIVKAYGSRVGNGDFITEIKDENIANYIRKVGHEYGSVTNRPRRVGWLDLVAIKYSIMISGITEVAITLIDVLNTISEINVCIGYKDQEGNVLPVHLPEQNVPIVPIMKTFAGWNDDYSTIKQYSDFSENCRKYIEYIESFLGVPVTIVSFGIQGEQTIRK